MSTLIGHQEIFNTQFYFKLTPGGLVQIWHNLALALLLWYEQIGESARNSTVLHAETPEQGQEQEQHQWSTKSYTKEMTGRISGTPEEIDQFVALLCGRLGINKL